ncbi:class I SAM-dependent methyltransferase [Pseudanabaena sp. UWO310]|uniref:class I SAM-dependent methyltransferase n=1 Tax=Pseudanabaena sp. UWO310 TaxID=2480795 RepID=UPI001160FA9D|nr:methyltransferase domain-containing protein [Pseudanabaena sp. UWO310]TYQ24019.1 methyltransferase domain-containing protein [Pseudanabaena sp. UWO310]
MKYLNLGCGKRFHPSWTNINFSSTDKNVIPYDLKKGIPYADESFDIVYHSHLLEHLSKNEAKAFTKECYRVLRRQGVLRVVVPDLEQIARLYINCLDNASNNFLEREQNYEWMLLEMYDQTVRNQAGGEMINFLSRKDILNQEFIIKRCGSEFKRIILASQKIDSQKIDSQKIAVDEISIKKLIKHLYRLLRYPEYRHQSLLKLILKPIELEALSIGQFRQSGEVHQWMYDRYSLSKLLQEIGLEQIIKRTAHESYISNWTSFNLDTEPDGSIYKPDSLYMEAIKPSL